MKKGFIGAYQLGTLSGASEVLKISEKITKKPGADLEGIFYSTAFQAGVDEFLVPNIEDVIAVKSDFIQQRTIYLDKNKTDSNYKLVDAAFAAYLPDDWERDDEYSNIWRIKLFLTELLTAMSLRSSLLLPSGIPDFSEAESQLPSELAEPISYLLSTLVDIQTPSPIPQKAIPMDDANRFRDIMSSDLFIEYVQAQADLDVSDNPIDKALPIIAEKGRELFTQNRHVLTLKKSSAGILQLTPKIIDAAFGKLPGALSEAAAKLGISLLESHQRIVIYDFRSITQNLLVSNLVRMLKEAEDKNEKN